jgi:uncharacterized repeat protein (TIGR01451 family)
MRKFVIQAVLFVAIAAAVQGQTIKVTETSPGNWSYVPYTAGGCGAGPYTDSTDFVSGPATPPIPPGSLEISTGTNGASAPRWWLTGWSGTRLDALTALGYSTYVDSNLDNQAIYLRLYLDLDGDSAVDDSIFFEPAYQNAAYMPGYPQASVALDTWQSWDALNGGWWSNNNLCSAGPGVNVKTIGQYLACNPNARIMDASTGGVSLQAGCGSGSWDNFTGNVDALRIATASADTTYDFDIGVANVTGTKTATVSSPVVGGTVTYTVTLTNNGDGDQGDNTGHEFVDVLPAELSLVSANATSGTTSTAANTVNWDGAIPAGGSVTITIQATIVAPGRFTNQGTIYYDSDGDGTNDSTSVTEGPGGGATEVFVAGPAVPTASTAGLALLALALAAGAIVVLRR